jgi:uncharacterized membrane protein YgaE (UPF0421/DUF939 family)
MISGKDMQMGILAALSDKLAKLAEKANEQDIEELKIWNQIILLRITLEVAIQGPEKTKEQIFEESKQIFGEVVADEITTH